MNKQKYGMAFLLLCLLVTCKSTMKTKYSENYFKEITLNGKIGTWDINKNFGWSFASDSTFYEYEYDEYGNKLKYYYDDIYYPDPLKFKISNDTLITPDFDSLQFKIITIDKNVVVLKEISKLKTYFKYKKDTVIVLKRAKRKYSY